MARNAPIRERTLRRLSILNGRARHSLPGTAPKHRSVFFHMPKCGGTSLSEAMQATVPFNQRIGIIDAPSTRRGAAILNFDMDDAFLCHEDLASGQLVFDLRETLFLQHMAWGTMLIQGHLPWSEKAAAHFGRDYRFVTLLRDPVARTVSNFRMTQRSGVTRGSFETYLESDIARRHARAYLRYLSGRNDISEDEVPDALALAKERLSRFSLIGFLEDIDDFLSRYRDLFGVRLRMGWLNRDPDRKPLCPDAQMQRLTELCAPDIEIHEFAKTLARNGDRNRR
ncbi:MAG: sulfotransferase family 2 domain-containing protein [Thalassovita sp.]|nr:sulfotransferase family 2 domain-containing protein [Thalassovita sp.]